MNCACRWPPARLDAAAIAALEEAFGAEHERTYGHRAGVEEPVELVSLEVIGRGLPDAPRAASAGAAQPRARRGDRQPHAAAPISARADGWLETASSTAAPCATPQPGPCIVEEYDTTCLIPPGWTARLDEHGNIIMTRATRST